MKRLFAILTAFVLFSCAAIGLQISDNATTVLQRSATSTVGYLIAKNNPGHVDGILLWHRAFQSMGDLGSVQIAFRDGMGRLASMVSGDPYLQLQIQNAMSLLEISAEGPQADADIGKYKDVVDAFMAGVMASRAEGV